MTEEIFRFKTPNAEKMRRYGFSEENGSFFYRTPILEGQFLMTVCVSAEGRIATELFDVLAEDVYTLHLVEDAAGEFVGRVREEYGAVLKEIDGRCFDREVFRCENTRLLIRYAREKHGDLAEYLWEKFPDNAVLRRQDNGKWYGAILTAERGKVGLLGEGTTEVLDVRADPREIAFLVDRVRIFPGWHMNKKHWISIPLDGTTPLEEIFERLEESYFIAGQR